jgi:glutamate-1-semialdehyde 2,1-aminomutase
MATPNRDLDEAVADAEARYVEANPRSRARQEEAKRWMPGGNTRTVLHYDPFPVAIERGEGASLIDIDGHRYTDLLGEYSAGLYGHSNPAIIGAIRDTLENGMVFGGPNVYEAALAEAFCERFPSVERIRFCNSGTEANLMALQLARALSGRHKVVVLEGGYHGGVFYYAPGATAMNLDIPVQMVRLNDSEGLLKAARAAGNDLAAIILEPLMGGAGCLPADVEFLQAARQAADETGAVLIFDEVMTSRLDFGGLQTAVGVTPDITTFGKYLGGGLSFGALGGRTSLMERFDPAHERPLAHSGTFNNNVLMMSAALAGLRHVLTREAIARVNALGDRLTAGVEAAAQRVGIPLCVTGRGSMIALHYQSDRPTHAQAVRTPAGWRKLMQLELLLRGVYSARRGFVALMVPMTEADVDRVIQTIDETLREYRSLAAAALD